jgi:formiminoglutamase
MGGLRVVDNADPNWPPASALLTDQPHPEKLNVALVGLPTYESSVTPRPPCDTPGRVRGALERYSTWSWTLGADLAPTVALVDLGDVNHPDQDQGRARARALLAPLTASFPLVAILGGDNAATHLAATGLAGANLSTWGLITLDAHLDLRDGVSNGSPVRQLLEDGLPGGRVVQVGLADFSNSSAYARRASEAGITVVSRHELETRRLEAVLDEALSVAGAGGGAIYVDVDLDVADRSVAPACPAAAPGGLSAGELRRAVRHLAGSPAVRAIDFVEVVAARDSADQRTIRLVALLLLEALSGALAREGRT